ncbi:MAG: PAS domain S-box protein, partial [Anaerolineales bacterium]|nr:PAS domain S-box protein [Anaerolineales bacterium]
MRVKIPGPILGSMKIVGLYLLVGFLWILFSDRLAAWLVTDKEVFRQVSTYKGWGYVFVTGILLYFLIKNHAEKISASETWLRMAHDAADMGTWRYDVVARKIFFDERSRRHYGFSEFEVSIADLISRVHPDDVSDFEQKFANALDSVDGGRYSTTHRVVHPDGSTRWLEVLADISFEGVGAKRRPIFGVGTSRDVTTAKQAELRVHYFSRLYATLSQVNQTIVRCHDQQELFESICRLAVEFGEFRLAWVGLLDEETGMLLPVAEYGFQDNKLPFREIDLRKMPFRDGLIGLAFRSGRVEICNDIQVEPHMTHWREIAIRDQYHSAAVVPIRRNSQVIGLLNLYAADIDFFMVMEEQKLLEEMSMDISYALDSMQLEKQREQGLKEIQEAEERFHKAFFSGPVGLAITRSSDGVYLDANPAFSRITGYSREELLGQTSLSLKIITPAQRQEYTRQIDEKGFIRDQEMILRSKTGEERIVLGAMEIIDLKNEVCVLSTAIDITERKKVNETLLHSEKRFRSLIENSLDNISLLAGDGKLLWESPATIRTLGYEENAFKGKNIFDLVHPDDAEWVMTQFKEVVTQP